jgi:integrase-like protein
MLFTRIPIDNIEGRQGSEGHWRTLDLLGTVAGRVVLVQGLPNTAVVNNGATPSMANGWLNSSLSCVRMALWQRGREGHPRIAGELIHHSDAGSQYTSLRLTEHLALEEIRPSIGSVGDAYDNALMESIKGLYKAECIPTTVFHDGPYKTIADVEYATAGWVDWYNNRRLHSTLGNAPPVEYEQAHYAALNREPHPV